MGLNLGLASPLVASESLENSLEIDFGKSKTGEQWQVINDGVMGGLSQGQKSLTSDSLLFQGDISLKNNGGFSSLKAPFVRTDLSMYESVAIRYRHQGHPVALTFEWHPRFYKKYHKVALPSTENAWKTIDIPLNTVQQYRMGKSTGRLMTKKDLAKVIRLGFIAGEKQESQFDLEVDYVKFSK